MLFSPSSSLSAWRGASPTPRGAAGPFRFKGSEFALAVDTVRVGIGRKPDLLGGVAELANQRGWVDADSVGSIFFKEELEIEVEQAAVGFQEIKTTITTEQAQSEAGRCLSCGLCDAFDECLVYWSRQAVTRD